MTMETLLASLALVLTPQSMTVIALVILFQQGRNQGKRIDEMRADMKEGFARMDKRFGEFQQLVLSVANQSHQAPAIKNSN